MMWAEACFSSLLVLSAFYLASASPDFQKPLADWSAYRHLEDSTVIVAESFHSNNDVQIALPSRMRALTKNTPFCLQFEPGQFAPSAIQACSGEISSRPQGKENSISTNYAAWHGGKLVVFTLRQWANPSP